MITIRHLALVALLPGLQACSSSGKGGSPGPSTTPVAGPSLPAPATLTVDLSVSPGGLNLDDLASGFTSVNDASYLAASDEILAVSVDLASPLSLPVAVLRTAAGVQPQQNADGDWVRSFDVGQAGKLWSVNLVATASSDQTASWSMRVSTKTLDSSGCCQNFELATGDASSTPGSGTWHVNDLASPSLPVRLFDVAYAVSDATHKTLTFDVGPSRPPAERLGGGSVVVYQTADDQLTLHVQDVSTGGEEIVGWSQATKAGSFTGLDGTKTCWDDASRQYADIACP